MAKNIIPPAPAARPAQVSNKVDWKPRAVTVVSAADWPISPIKSMRLPAGWSDTYPWADLPPKMYDFDFSPGQEKDAKVKINFRCRGAENSEEERRALAAALLVPGRLDDKRARALFGDKCQGMSFETIDWNGKPVIQTFRTEADGYRSWTLFYNGNAQKNDLPYLASLTFAAPAAKYDAYLAAVKKSFKLIIWQ